MANNATEADIKTTELQEKFIEVVTLLRRLTPSRQALGRRGDITRANKYLQRVCNMTRNAAHETDQLNESKIPK